jgi:hypothetical protein
VRFKVVFEREPLTQLPVFILIKPPSEIVSTAKLVLGERELRGPDVSITIKDYKFLTAKGMTWGGKILCDISVKRRINPSMAFYNPELSFYRRAWVGLQALKTPEGKVPWSTLDFGCQTIEPALFSGSPTPMIMVWGKGSEEVKDYVKVQFLIDWFPMVTPSPPPPDVPLTIEQAWERAREVAGMIGISENEAVELLLKKFQVQEVTIYPGLNFSAIFELRGWYTPRAHIYGRIAGERKWTDLQMEAKFPEVDKPTKVEVWEPLWKELGVTIENISVTLNTLTDAFNKWTENAVRAYKNLVDEFNRQMELIENRILTFEQRVGEAMRKHENWTLEQLEAIRDWVVTSITETTKPALVVYAPQTAYAGVPNAFSIQPLNCVITDVRLEDATGVLWAGVTPFFTATPRVPGSGLRLTVKYQGTTGVWAGKIFTKSYEIPFTYLTSVTWENQQPVVAPSPEPMIKAWHLLVIGGVVFGAVLGIGLWRRR